MNIKAMVALVATAVILAACGDDGCTQEEYTAKTADLTAKLTALATTDAAKAATLQPKLAEIASKGATDLAAACKAVDEMIAELAK